MNTDYSWLPPLVPFSGKWEEYLEAIYRYFFEDFVFSKPKFGDKRVALKRHPIIKGKEATFWHFISENPPDSMSEEDRIPDFRRCERIRWPKPVMEQYGNKSAICWWKTIRPSRRGTTRRILLALDDFSYIIVVDEHKDYVLPWTHFPVESMRRREILKQEYEKYWIAQKAGDAV